jgi:hypothetical protein
MTGRTWKRLEDLEAVIRIPGTWKRKLSARGVFLGVNPSWRLGRN